MTFGKKFNRRKREAGRAGPGFTLIELLVVILIAGMLAALSVPAIRRTVERTRENRARADLRHLAAVVSRAYDDVGFYVRLEDLVEEDHRNVRRWRNQDYRDGFSDNDAFMVLASTGRHTGAPGPVLVDSGADWPENIFSDRPATETPVNLYNLSTEHEPALGVIVSNTGQGITSDPPIDWKTSDVYRIGADRDVASHWRGPYLTYRNFVDLGQGRRRPIDPWGERRDELSAPFHQYRMFWSTHPSLLMEGVDGVMVIISAGPSGRLESLPGAPRPDQATRADFRLFDPSAAGDDIFIAFSAGLSMVTAFSEVRVHEVVFNLDGKGTRTGGGHLLQRVVHNEAATAPDVQPISAAGWRYLRAWTPSFARVTRDLTIDPVHEILVTYRVEDPDAGAIRYGAADRPQRSFWRRWYLGSGATGVTVAAVPNEGYRFLHWDDGLETAHRPADRGIMEPSTYTARFIRIYDIVLEHEPAEGGTVSGAGTYDHGESVSVSAQPATGYYFSAWTEGGLTVSTDPVYTFTAEADRTLRAVFEPAIYEIQVSAQPSAGGTVSGGGSYSHGQPVNLQAVPAADHDFVSWTEGGSIVSANQDYLFTAVADRSLVANFQLKTYAISVSAQPSAGGAAGGGGTYTHGQSAIVSAAPASGYDFVNWTEGATVVSVDPDYSFTVLSSRTLRANFQPRTWTVSVSASPAEGGTASGGGTYQHGQGVTVTAIPGSGYDFANWTEGGTVVSTSSSYAFTIASNRSLQANFAVTPYLVSVSAQPPAGGSAAGGGTYLHGQSATVTASPAAGYDFVNWTEGGTVVSGSAAYTFTVNESRTLRANFALRQYTVTVAAQPTAGGTVSGGGTYDHGQGVTVTASPAAGYDFVNWTEGGTVVSSTSSYNFTASADRALGANFSLREYPVTLQREPAEGGTVSGGGTYPHGQSATVIASPATGYDFVNWTEGGTVVSGSASHTFTVTAPRTLRANFEARVFEVSLSAEPAEGGTVSGGGTYSWGQSATAAAAPVVGYSFRDWTEDGTTVSESASYVFTVTASRSLRANFEYRGEYTLEYRAATGGSISGPATQQVGHGGSGDPVTAVPGSNHYFTGWSDGRLDNPRFEENVTGPLTVTARFALRFTDHGDGTVTDHRSGLIWSRDAGLAVAPHQEAVEFAAGSELAGHTDWRLPLIGELEALSDPARQNPSLPETHPFHNVAHDRYWSATPGTGVNYRWLDFADGSTGQSGPGEYHHAWLVREPEEP